MAWKTSRSGRRYYYRSQRQGQNVTSEYIGAGVSAQLIAMRDEQERQERKVRQEGLQRLKAEQDAIDKQIDELGKLAGNVATAVLLASGYHQHRRKWRKQRAINQD